jgi:hypothetical protein
LPALEIIQVDRVAPYKVPRPIVERFPLLGSELGGRWQDFRFVLGPWRWMVIVYAYIEHEDRIVVVTIQDGRSSSAGGSARTAAAHALTAASPPRRRTMR